MTKKEYLLQLMTALEGKWSIAAGLKLLVEQNVLDDQTIDALQKIFSDAIEEIADQNAKNSLIKSQEFLKKLAEKERQQQIKDDELNQLLADI